MEGPSKGSSSTSKTLGLRDRSKVGPTDMIVLDTASQASSNKSKTPSNKSTTSNLLQDMKSGSNDGSTTNDSSLVIDFIVQSLK